jgi:hypothetical protein
MAWGSNATARKWHIRANGASGVMRTEFAGGQNFATTSIIDGEWHHVASVFPNGATEGEQILHYIDGVLDPQAGGTSLTIDTEIVTDADIDWTNANSAESYPVHIGARLTHGWGNMLIGSMADVRIYNQGLSEEQIRFIFEGETVEPEPEAPSISLVRNADGTLTVTYTGKLQTAPTVNGPWEDVEGATSPLTLQPDQPVTFGRTVSE